jgi:hypothetical protein
VFLLAKERSDVRTLQPAAAKHTQRFISLFLPLPLPLRESTYHHRWFCRRYG